MKKLLSFILVICLGFCFVGCSEKPATPTTPPEQRNLATPTELTARLVETGDGYTGVVSWAPVENATSYIITLNGDGKTVRATSYYIQNVNVDYQISVVATAEGYNNSSAAVTTLKRPEVSIGIEGSSEVRSGGFATLKAQVNGTSNKAVTWEITDGGDFAAVDENGVLTAKEVTGDKMVTVKATSVADPAVSAVKCVTIMAKPQLTQSMLDALNVDKLGFEGYLVVNLYSAATGRFDRSLTYDIKTVMDGTNWYAEYDMDSGVSSGLYYKNHNSIASLVSVSFKNDESYTPMLDDDGKEVSWADSGLYNNFKNLSVNNFPVDEETWRLTYTTGDRAKDKEFAQRVVASACPYDFDAKNISLIVEGGEIAGIFAVSESDYSVAEQYRAEMELTVAINIGESVGDVPTIGKYEHDPIHDQLQKAIDNMQELTNYTTDFFNVGANVMTSSIDYTGYDETVTDKICHFKDYQFTPDSNSAISVGNGTKKYVSEYGYVDRSTNDKKLYNSYYVGDDDIGYTASRAYEADFSAAKPSFDFAAELFTKYYKDDEDGTITYYVDAPMSAVASLFYYGVGNDVALYGMFAQEGQISATSSFTPYVVVKDDYIVESGFYYYLGYLYGVVEISYSDFNNTSTEGEVEKALEQMATRQVPMSWSDVKITVTEEDKEQNALDYLKNFYGEKSAPCDNIANYLPFFNIALGDTYGFGLTTIKTYGGNAHPSVVFYCDVPLDINYTIESSLSKVRQLLENSGFTKDKNGVFSKKYKTTTAADGNKTDDIIFVQPVDSSLDLNIYIWRDSKKTTAATEQA